MITRQIAKSFNEDLRSSLKPLEDKYGIKINFGTLRFSDVEMKTTLTAEVLNVTETNGSVIEKRQSDFNMWCFLAGLKAEDYGKVFVHNGKTYKIIGIKPRAKKNNVMLEHNGNSTYTASDYIVRRLIGRE